ncbi:diguanylate cyclase [Marinobacteraceae bacterium S3BR75-40.1]
MTETMSNPALQDKITALRRQYLARAEAELEDLEQAIQALLADVGNLEQLPVGDWRQRLGEIAGAAGAFGLPELGNHARQLERLTAQWQETPSGPETSQLMELASRLAALREEVRLPVPANTPLSEHPTRGGPVERQALRISILEDDEAVGQTLAAALHNFGYQVALHTQLEGYRQAVTATPPDIMIVDALTGGQAGDSLRDVAELKQTLNLNTPVLVISSRTDFDTFRQAVHAGAVGYFIKPVDVAALENAIEAQFFPADATPYRILLVVDDLERGAHAKMILEAAGMQIRLVEKPEHLLDNLRRFDPDVLLLDFEDPTCSAPELGQIVRLHSDWLRTPIVYLCADEDITRHALAQAGEDFLVRPLSDATLVAAMLARARHARELRAALHRDSLTGLLGHVGFKEQLHRELERSQRSGKPFSVALLNLDEFRIVNESFGYAAGDNVLRTLANLMRQRLRRSDTAGRFSGEEFVVILPDCNAGQAREVIEDIRERMGAIRFLHEGQHYHVTLTAGIASTQAFDTAESLLEATSSTVRQAKEAGRNRVMLASPPA